MSQRDRKSLGNKGFHLVELAGRGYPVPPFDVLTAEHVAAGVARDEVAELLGELRTRAHSLMGADRPVGFAVRSSPPVSMPGMMDTILAVGLGEHDLPALSVLLAGDEPAAALVAEGRRALRAQVGSDPGVDPVGQVLAAVEAVRASWDNERARQYRRAHDIGEDNGPAVVVQVMAFGSGALSGSGVAFSHDPRTGRPGLSGEYLPASTGEALVAGQVTPEPLDRLAAQCPSAYAQLDAVVRELFRWHKHLVEVEFVVETGTLWLVQLRAATASPAAHTHVAIDAWRSGVLDRDTALTRLSAEALGADSTARAAEGHAALLATGVPASPGVAVGRVVCASEQVLAHPDEPVVLLRPRTEPEDFVGMVNAAGIVTMEGGFGSHAAVVARELGVPAVVGVGDGSQSVVGLAPDTTVTVCGTTGRIWAGEVPVESGTAVPWPADLLGPEPAGSDRQHQVRTLLAGAGAGGAVNERS
ncbi:PEP/pyruvate-binding domain-containing protein [Nocardia cyriacigeorgica]|uniref:PEP/pyruvate-binding domain-containing protein n=1 Tax=Nocardia cyriacigeorgica TaxID=135487 RepID=UPI00189625AF|nr:PEP/pyruvate-binding domain-containing protein [Nocardia cyriacigeorgica]MBF6452145.1 pyruvate, phosphate dikinase [Nocardia cyriacigeorgica]MBF6478074.1 pyruvate, phosphate dikinase [Nocardia cyriacigeorgica]MBF6549314.1 pyruvate, phosphate dikinase [Nocardia cyriacigeorgica]